MIATLVVEYADGTTADVCERNGLEDARFMPPQAGTQKGFDDCGMEDGSAWTQTPGPTMPAAGASLDSRFGKGAAAHV